ncbi:MAG: SDR family NAD(P)-dependent oxidoreductase [Thermoanaerobaculia bacterium]
MTERNAALITGASSGIGLSLARLFARDHHDVVLVARSEGKLRELSASLQREHGITAHVIAADLSKPNAPKEVWSATAERGIGIDTLVNNAGHGITGEFVDTDLKTELEMIQVNIAALTHLTKLVLPAMIARHSGRILNVASTAGFQPGPLMAVYYASKAYVLSFSEAISDELRHSGVTVTTLCPGPTDTPFAVAAKMTHSRLFTMTRPMSSEAVARAGYEAMKRGKGLTIVGMRNRLLVQSNRVTPRRVVTAIVRKLQETRQ